MAGEWSLVSAMQCLFARLHTYKEISWYSLRVLLSLLAVVEVTSFSWILRWQGCFLHTIPHIDLILDMEAHLKDHVSHYFFLSVPPRLSGSAGSCHTHSGLQRSSRHPGICLLSVTAADWQCLPGWQSLIQLPHGLGSKLYHNCEEGCHHLLPLEHGSTHSKSGSSALPFNIVWMTRYYSSCSPNGSLSHYGTFCLNLFLKKM